MEGEGRQVVWQFHERSSLGTKIVRGGSRNRNVRDRHMRVPEGLKAAVIVLRLLTAATPAHRSGEGTLI